MTDRETDILAAHAAYARALLILDRAAAEHEGAKSDAEAALGRIRQLAREAK